MDEITDTFGMAAASALLEIPREQLVWLLEEEELGVLPHLPHNGQSINLTKFSYHHLKLIKRRMRRYEQTRKNQRVKSPT